MFKQSHRRKTEKKKEKSLKVIQTTDCSKPSNHLSEISAHYVPKFHETKILEHTLHRFSGDLRKQCELGFRFCLKYFKNLVILNQTAQKVLWVRTQD